MVQHRLNAIKPPLRGQPAAELIEYLAVLPGFAGRVDHFIVGLNHEAGMHVVDIVDFQPVRRRQDDIGVFRHRPHELIALYQ